MSIANLSPEHLADLRKSGLSDATIAAAGIYTERNPEAIAKILRWKKPAKHLGDCMVIPFYGADGSALDYRRIKSRNPRQDKSGKTIKYESAIGQPNRPYIPPGSRAALADATVPLALTEGEKKSLCADQYGIPTLGLVGVWGFTPKRKRDATGRGIGERKLIPDMESIAWTGRRVTIIFDSDAADKEQIQIAERCLADALEKRGAIIRIVRLPHSANGEKQGLDDFIVNTGVDRLRELIDQAEPLQPSEPVSDGRVQVLLGPDEHRVNDAVAVALANVPNIYQRNGQLVRVINDAECGPRVDEVPGPALRDAISAHVAFLELDKKQRITLKHPPTWNVQAVAARGQWTGVPSLAGVVTSPVMRPDGSVLTQPGYDPATGLYLNWARDPLTIPDQPSLEYCRAELAMLLDLVADFPFAAEMHKAAWVAGLLTPLARPMFNGPAPLFLADANVRAAGKGMILDCIGRIVSGHSFPVISYSSGDENELRKKITTLLIYGHRLCLLDNITGNFGNGCIDAALTSTNWQDRVLGENRQYQGPMMLTIYATGNNVAVAADTSRRICHIRLESQHEKPENRSDFQRPNLMAYVSAHRERLLAAALTILRGYHIAGRPDMKLKPWGSFEQWSAIVRNAVAWVGLPDPGLTRQVIQDQADETARGLRQLITALRMIDPDGSGLSAAEMVRRATEPAPGVSAEVQEMLHDAIGMLISKMDGRKLGNRLRHLRRRVVDGFFIDLHGETANRVNRWSVFSAQENWHRDEKHAPHALHPGTGAEHVGYVEHVIQPTGSEKIEEMTL